MSPARPELSQYFHDLDPCGRLEPLAGDASTRRFFRWRSGAGSTAVVMDYGAPFEGLTDDVRLARLFREADLPVAGILEVLPALGCIVLDDLGDRTLASETSACRAAGQIPERLYERAVDLALAIAARGTAALARSERAAGPALDEQRFQFEMDFFLEHFVSGHLGRGCVPPDARQAAHDLAAEAAATPRQVLCHRDYHSRNLMVLRDDALAMVDIQDARWGPDTYDLASLVYDAYTDFEPGLRDRLVGRYLDGLEPPTSREAFRARLEVVALERMIKALGTFGYQAEVRGKRGYLEAVPRTVRRVRALRERLPRFGAVIDLLAE